MTLKAPFPYFGGKRSVADLIWQRFGDVPNALFGPPPPHVFAIGDAFLFRVTRRDGSHTVAMLALSLRAIRRPAVAVKIRDWFALLAGSACLCDNAGTVPNFVDDVLTMGVPTQVLGTVVRLGRVGVVAGFHAVGPRPDEGHKYQFMDALNDRLAINTKIDPVISRASFLNRKQARGAYLPSKSCCAPFALCGPNLAIGISKVVRECWDAFHSNTLHKPTRSVKAGRANADKESLWFSPHCLPPTQERLI